VPTSRGTCNGRRRNIVARGYVAVYQDCRGRHGSEGEDRVYADDALRRRAVLFVDQHRVGEAKFADRGGDLRDLLARS
jgi:hypothetical protein